MSTSFSFNVQYAACRHLQTTNKTKVPHCSLCRSCFRGINWRNRVTPRYSTITTEKNKKCTKTIDFCVINTQQVSSVMIRVHISCVCVFWKLIKYWYRIFLSVPMHCFVSWWFSRMYVCMCQRYNYQDSVCFEEEWVVRRHTTSPQPPLCITKATRGVVVNVKWMWNEPSAGRPNGRW